MTLPTRRNFLAGSAAVASSLSLPQSLPAFSKTSAAGDEELRVALIGCGGRGTGAVNQALSTAGKVRLVAMADAFSDRLEGSLAHLTELKPEQVDVPPERRFIGFDAYRKAIDLDVDVIILATPPGFRPIHFEYAVEKSRHIFMEKPVAVDGPGIRKVLAAAEAAKAKGLKIGVGLQRHHQAPYQEIVRRIHAGELGDLYLLRCYWNSAGVWVRGRKPEWNEMEYQMRNWYYFNWLCGDHIVEQHIHNLDVCNWVMKGYPVKAQGQGGRLIRNGKDHGQIFDHHMLEYTYADGTKMLSQCRHMPECRPEVNEHVHGSLGIANMGRANMKLNDGSHWRFTEKYQDPYQVEHDVLFDAIRTGQQHNEAENGAMSTMTSILGRMATYCGKEVSMDQALSSELDASPQSYEWDATPPVVPDEQGDYPVPTPGITASF
jgi:predicted dehydrogenase